MTSNKLFIDRHPLGGLTWARYRDGDEGKSTSGKPLATMSEATRAAVLEQARRAAAAGDPLIDHLTGLVGEVFLAHGWLTQLFSTIKDSVDLTGTEALTLYAVVNSGKPVTVPQIGRTLGHARQVIQRAANTLVERGFLETKDNPAHKRAALLVATKAGREVKLGFDAAGRAMTETLAEALDLDMAGAVLEGLRQLRRAAECRAREQSAAAAGKA
jgi:DNA-binding MarR family transcriptional regulator